MPNPSIERQTNDRLDMYRLRVRVRPHNNLEALVHYHVGVVKEKLSNGDHEGIVLDCTSAVIAMAFCVEALLNYVGAQKVPGWKERASYRAKFASLEGRCSFVYDESVEPYKTLALLKQARDKMAHGQPIEFQATVQSRKEMSKVMVPAWSATTEPEVVLNVYETLLAFKASLFMLAGIKPGAALTSAAGGGSGT